MFGEVGEGKVERAVAGAHRLKSVLLAGTSVEVGVEILQLSWSDSFRMTGSGCDGVWCAD